MSKIKTIHLPREEKFTALNFTLADELLITASAIDMNDNVFTSVCMTSGRGSCSFQFDQTPDQARTMAAQLLRLADAAERLLIEATMQAELAAEQAAA